MIKTPTKRNARRGAKAVKPRTRKFHSAGGFVMQPGTPVVLLIKNTFDNQWTFPKGGIEDGESPEQAAIREVREETGLAARVIERLGENRYHFRFFGKPAFKVVDIFLMETIGPTDLLPSQLDPESGRVAAAAWVPADEVVERVGYKNLKPLARQAAERVKELAE